MSHFKETLIKRFGEHRVVDISVDDGEIPLLAIDIESRTQVTVICTNGLSEFRMPVPEKLKDRAYNELCFCLPSYWEWEDIENPNMNWIFPWLQKLSKHVVEKNTWYAHGHTFTNEKDITPLSPTMLQNNLMLSDPILLENELQPISVEDKLVRFLTIIPIFEDELEYKHMKGTFKFMQKLTAKGTSELLDDFRKTSLRGKWRLF